MFYAGEVSNYTPRRNGREVVGALATFFDAGTNTPKEMYTDDGLSIPFDPGDITTDAEGQFPPIYGQGGAYDCLITTASGTVLRRINGVGGDVESGGGGGGGGGAATDIPPGFIMPALLVGTQAGWLPLNGETIGSSGSGATGLADDTAEDLFTALWSNSLIPVSGGRGVSAAADWSANKTITLPDSQCRALVGVDGMGATALGLLSSLTFTTGNATTVGSLFGATTHTLTSAQMPAHTHTGTTSTDGAHSHTGTTNADGSHTHTGSTSTDGNHAHTGSTDADGAHAHGGTTDAAGTHAHGITLPLTTTAQIVELQDGDVAVPSYGSGFYITDVVGNHQHSFTTGVVATHQHTFTTAGQGSHNHSLNVNASATHTHAFSTSSSGSHFHSFTTASTGSGGAHPIVQPSLAVSFYVKL